MKLYDELLCRTKEDLYNYARSVGVSNISKLRKNQLAEAVSKLLCDDKYLAAFFYSLSEINLNIVKKVLKNKVKKTVENADDYFYLYCRFMIYEEDGYFYIPEELKNAINKLFNSEYSNKQPQINWIIQCITFANDFYGIYTMDDLMKLIKLNKKLKVGYNNIPEIKETMDLYQLAMKYEDSYVSETAIDFGFGRLKLEQENKNPFIPTCEQISFYYHYDFLLNHQNEALRKELIKRTEGVFIANSILALFFKKALMGVASADIISLMSEILDFKDEEDATHMVSLIIQAYNHTNMMCHRGNTPNDIKYE